MFCPMACDLFSLRFLAPEKVLGNCGVALKWSQEMIAYSLDIHAMTASVGTLYQAGH